MSDVCPVCGAILGEGFFGACSEECEDEAQREKAELALLPEDDRRAWLDIEARVGTETKTAPPPGDAWAYARVLGPRKDGQEPDRCPDCGHEPETCGGAVCPCQREVMLWRLLPPSSCTGEEHVTYDDGCHTVAIYAHPNPAECPCAGQGWISSDYDTWERCPHHHKGQERPE